MTLGVSLTNYALLTTGVDDIVKCGSSKSMEMGVLFTIQGVNGLLS